MPPSRARLPKPDPAAFAPRKDGAIEEVRRLLTGGRDPAATSPAAHGSHHAKSPGGRHHGRMTEEEEDRELLSEELAGSHTTSRVDEQPKLIEGGTMRPYQVEGLNWLIRCYETGVNGILADEMGLGKTLQTISMLAFLKEFRNVDGKHLVIAPKSTLANWMKELRRWFPSTKPFMLLGSKEERAAAVANVIVPQDFDVLVTSYEAAIIERASLQKIEWHYFVIDEAHRIKNENSKLANVVRLFRSQSRLLLTGTPLQNNMHELWALLNFLLPEVFDDASKFDAWFAPGDGSKEDEEARRQGQIQLLHKVLRPFLLRRLKVDVEKSLLPKKEVTLFVGMTRLQKELYRNLLKKDLEAVNGLGVDRTRLLNILMQLRKCCGHPYLFDGVEPGPPYVAYGEHLVTASAKFIVLDKLLKYLKPRGSRVLVFSQMTRLLDILEDLMIFREYEYCRIDGNTSGEDREEAIESFNAENSSKFVFLLSSRAGGLGINLQTADTVIMFDSDWNPQVDLQAIDRAHRIGQKKQVHVYRLITEGSVEEKVLERALKKLMLDQLVIQQGRLSEKERALSKGDMLAMIRHGAERILSSPDADFTDEDIETLLGRAASQTDEMKNRFNIKEESLAKWSFDTMHTENSLYSFEGVDYADLKRPKRGKDGVSLQWIEPPKRERKQNYSVDEYYREALRSAEAPKIRRPPKALELFDFHFAANLPRLKELMKKERDLWEKARKASRRGTMREGLELTEEEKKEKADLVAKTFHSWTKREFSTFCRSMERYGRDAIEKIAQNLPHKTVEEVRAYSKAFWKNYQQVKNWKRIIDMVVKGEERLQRQTQYAEILEKKVASCDDPWNELQIPYEQANNKRRDYSPEEDRFLLCMSAAIGYGEWESVRLAVRKHWMFRFDWFIKSRTSLDIHRRVDTLIRLIEKEMCGTTTLNQHRRKWYEKRKKESGRKRRHDESDEDDEDDEEEEGSADEDAEEEDVTSDGEDEKPSKGTSRSKGAGSSNGRAAKRRRQG